MDDVLGELGEWDPSYWEFDPDLYEWDKCNTLKNFGKPLKTFRT